LNGKQPWFVRTHASKYAEQRLEATGLIGERLHVMIYCLRSDVVRVISLRKANPREVRRYVAEN
jgi:uncharacterized DUF497 family protein